ncbi:hypothetical protein ACOCEA_03355 [Maribacter sp. CXY002]|uniref:hypothetical protein n=1 Tax=Maribacter luteocoastalis TaxID=3407671 RepID=UPI003B684C0E
MNPNRKRLNAIAIFLTTLLLFQSCVVYHKTPTTLEKASTERINTKVTNSSGENVKYKYITYENGIFFGVTLKSGQSIKTPIDQNDLAQVLTKNKSGSTWATITTIAIPVIATVIIVSTLPWGGSWDLFPGEEL